MMTRQSFDGAASTGSSAAEMLRLPAFTSTARRPPNSGMVFASSTSRDGLAESSSPSMRTKRERIVGIVDRGAHQRVDALAHQPGVRPEHQHDRLGGIGPGDEAVDVGGFDGGHGYIRSVAYNPAAIRNAGVPVSLLNAQTVFRQSGSAGLGFTAS